MRSQLALFAPPAPAWPDPVAGGEVLSFSLWEPWASLMMVGAKTVETRSWETARRGPLLICAALKHDQPSLELLWDPVFQAALWPLRRPGAREVTVGDLHFGRAVCLVDLLDCTLTCEERDLPSRLSPELLARERPFGDFSARRSAWVTGNRRVFPPFPVRGSQGLFDTRLPADFSCAPAPAWVPQP